MTETLTEDRLHELLHFDPSTGIFTWLEAHGDAWVGSICDSDDIFIDGLPYRAYSLASFYMTGKWDSGVSMDGEVDDSLAERKPTPEDNEPVPEAIRRMVIRKLRDMFDGRLN